MPTIFNLIDRIQELSDLSSHMYGLDERATFNCTPSKFSIIVPESLTDCVFSVQIMPQFFTQYVCDRIYSCSFPTDDFYFKLVGMKSNGFNSLTFSIARHQNHATLEFKKENDPDLYLVMMATIPWQVRNVGQIDYSFFVSFAFHELQRIMWQLEGARAHVTVTESEIKFAIPNKDIILTTEARRCIIGGVVAGDVIQFAINIQPVNFFYNLTSKRIWLFKSIESNGIILTAPVKLHIEISSFFPECFRNEKFSIV